MAGARASLLARCGGAAEGTGVGRDRSLPTTSQSPASASHGSGQRRSAGRRPRQPRPAGMAAGDGGAAALSTRRAGRRGSVSRAPLEPAGAGRGACGGEPWEGAGAREGGRGVGGGEAVEGEGMGVPQATVAGRRASGLGVVWASKCSRSESAWLLGVGLPVGKGRRGAS